MEGVQQRFQELNDKVNSVSKRCQALKQRMDKEIPIITEVVSKQINNVSRIYVKEFELKFVTFRKIWKRLDVLSDQMLEKNFQAVL